MTIEGPEDLRGLRLIGALVAQCLEHVKAQTRAGVTTAWLDEQAGLFMREHGMRSAPRQTYNFPGWVCISVNEEVAHGVPGQRVICEGDMVHVDVSASLNGYFADTGASFVVGQATARQEALMCATREALAQAMQRARAGQPFRAVGMVVDQIAREAGFKVLEDLGAHGIGRALHEPPEFIPHHKSARERRRFKEGQVITLEPFLTTGRTHTQEAADGWTLLNSPGSWTAQYEHTFVVTRGEPVILTLP